ncbi:MAG: J domain-containing protein [Capsulimonadaceae bacterium]
METASNYYQVLGVSPTDSPEAIKTRYRALAREFHPDLATQTPNALRTFMSITRAYRTLGDPDRRRKYDSDQKILVETERNKAALGNLERDAEAALMGGLLAKARGICEAMLEVDANHVRALHMLGDALAGQQKTAAALDAYRRALSLSPGATLQAKVSRMESARAVTVEAAPSGSRAAAKPMERRPSLVGRLFLHRT